ncbi:phage tail tape measure protein [Mesorhizobium sp. INR15]|uniref:phage tail tape measure protein n=1 Tax=Mesorhizobium sp. INR15 TaxID=2654248 RepID=UPI0018966ECB|nr:phage tail tape measure protein [Mesorhizobium sp. INR15]QPC93539.1 hypothetical protein GA829_24825 [Mesorhizobium sp. INR15]
MSDKTDDLIISVSTDVSTIKRQLKQLGDSIGQTTSGIQKQFDALGKGIDQSFTPVQRRINDMVGIPYTGKVKEWTGALSGFGKELGNTGHAAGASATQMMALQHSARSMIEQIALGTSPLQALTAQFSHLSYVASQPGGLTGALKSAGSTIVGLATKFPEVTAAIAVAGAAFVAYEALGGTNLRTLDDILKTHEANILLLGDAYDQVAGKQQKYAALTARSVNAANSKDLQDAKDVLSGQIKGIFDSIYQTIGAGGGGQGALQTVLKSQFEPFKQALADLAKSHDVKAFIDQLAAISEVNPKLESARAALADMAAEAAKTQAALPNLGHTVDAVTDTVNAFALQLANVDSKPIQAELQALFDKARDGKEPIDAILQSLAALEQANPNFSGIIAGFAGMLKAAAATDAALDALGSKYFANQGGGPNSRQKLPVGLLPDSAPIPGEAPNREDQGAYEDKLAAKAARGHKSKAPAQTAMDQFAGDLQSIKDRTAALNEEFNSLGLSYEAQTKRKISLQLEQTALKQVREEARKKGDVDYQNAQLTPAQIAAIDQVSEAYARQADELRKAQESQALQRDVLKGAFDDFRSALESGQLSWKTFADIATHALDKIISKIENDLIDSILQANSAAGGGGGGILGGVLGFLTGGGGGSSNAFPGGGSLNSTGGLYADGGYTGAGGKNQKAGIVHKGEVVFSQDDIRRNGGVAAVEALRRGGSIAAPNMPSISAPARGGDNVAVNNNISIDARGAQQGVGDEIKRALAEYDRHSVPRTVAALRQAKIRGMA